MSDAGYDPGWLRHRIVIEAPSGASDDAGGETVTWSTLATLWSRIVPASAVERPIADHLAALVTHVVTVRYREDVAGGMRVAYRGRIFRVLAVHDPDEGRRTLEILAAEERP